MSTEEETPLEYPTKSFDKSVYDELKRFIQAWVRSGVELTEADIEAWKRKNLKPPKQLSLFDAGEVRDINVAVCPDCKGRGCGNCDGGVKRVTSRTFTVGPTEVREG